MIFRSFLDRVVEPGRSLMEFSTMLFFIVWGTKVVKRTIGRVADFCPVCRGFRPFHVTHVQKVGHLYYIPLGSRESLGHVRTCSTCRVAFEMDRDRYPAVSRSRALDVEELITETNPELKTRAADRLEIERLALANKIGTEDRRALIREPFLLLDSRVQDRVGQMHFDRTSGLCGLATIVLPIVILTLIPDAALGSRESIVKAALGLGGILGVATLVLLYRDARRFTRRVVQPTLARSLRPLNPTSEELHETLDGLKRSGRSIARFLKADELHFMMTSGLGDGE